MDASELSGDLAHETAVLRRIARHILLAAR
jgi:hypothetical protein